ncbi:MAG TPA: hypothetical protein VG345_09225 [Bryobacteraceae bacterium]|jgi:hypothetical protein|nr:hypothetical protein [Bryobacteraceae bacterium]
MHKGPPLGIVALVFVLLFLGGLYPVTAFHVAPAFPGPREPSGVITEFFRSRPFEVLLCAALHFGAAIPLGIFTATAVSRLRFLGVRAAGADIALFGGFLTAFTMIVSSSVLWAMSYPEVAQNSAAVQALYRIQFALGGPGFSVPLGLLLAGLSITAGFAKLLPKWLALTGVLIAVAGELSWLDILFPRALPLIPLTRFPGFLWLIAAGFWLPRSISREGA